MGGQIADFAPVQIGGQPAARAPRHPFGPVARQRRHRHSDELRAQVQPRLAADPGELAGQGELRLAEIDVQPVDLDGPVGGAVTTVEGERTDVVAMIAELGQAQRPRAPR